ncbi:MAG: hypothetical protein K2N91_04600 [Muribaculaceae bacterium]|nr:hypothetical protein [Muribaculaceae bacterium]
MKRFVNAVSFLLLLMLTGCVDEVTTSFFGIVNVTPKQVANGDIVIFSIDDSFVSVSTTINGEDAIKSIIYYIDEIEVAKSTDKSDQWKATYQINNLSIGLHTVSAHCESRKGSYTVEEQIKSAQIEVVPDTNKGVEE